MEGIPHHLTEAADGNPILLMEKPRPLISILNLLQIRLTPYITERGTYITTSEYSKSPSKGLFDQKSRHYALQIYGRRRAV